MMKKVNMTPAAIAVNRFGLGAVANEPAPSNPKQWLHQQLKNYNPSPAAWEKQPRTDALIKKHTALKTNKSYNKAEKKMMRRSFNRNARKAYDAAINMRMQSAITTNTPFVERLVHFWANHFAISIEKPDVRYLAAAYELDAIRPFILGDFKDMLMAVEKHPAMLLYLNQANSIGPNSRTAVKVNKRRPQKSRGLNENLAREIMELHTLGVRSGYTQSDVTEFAKALTGWSTHRRTKGKNISVGKHGFIFRETVHEPGTRTILGKPYAQKGLQQAEAVLEDLANSEETAQHLATKLARHFVSDNPPESLVKKLTDAYMQNQGNLSSMYKVLIEAPEAWTPHPGKFKTPWEWLVSILRGTHQTAFKKIKISQVMKQLSHPVWKPGSPAGYDDLSASWLAPNALLRRVEVAQRLASFFNDRFDARQLGQKILLDAMSKETQTEINRSESAVSGLALLFVSPEFLRR